MEKSKHNAGSSLKVKCFLAFLMIGMFAFTQVNANNLTITSFSVNQGASTVTFNLAWDNSWHGSIAIPPVNWDAAWVFVKFRNCDSTTQYTHGLVSTTVGDHTISGTTALEFVKRDGSVGIDAAPNNTGVMLRNSVFPYTASSISSTITLKLTNLPATGSLDVRIIGIEMVYIPQANYDLGDANPTPSAASWGSFATTKGGWQFITITSENALTVNETNSGTVNGGGCYVSGCALTAAYPKGWAPFFIMKYEITQGQYADFLNINNFNAQNARFPVMAGNARHTITSSGTIPNRYVASRPDRACNWLSWEDVSAYLDWAALRPLTELEFEKAARGTDPAVNNEFVWGSGTWQAYNATGLSGAETGTETVNNPANANVVANCASFSGGDGGQGPLRAGIFAKSTTTTRLQTGAGFYGAMEMAGNVGEYYISAPAGIATGSSSTGVSLGDGYIDNTTALHNVSNWPSATAPGNNLMLRGGNWCTSSGMCQQNYTWGTNSSCYLAISNRYENNYNSVGFTRNSYRGGRGGR